MSEAVSRASAANGGGEAFAGPCAGPPPGDGAPAILLRVRDLRVAFGGIAALDGVSFDLHQGRILALIGPNGAGKTTLFNCLSRLHHPSAGDIVMDGTSLLTRPAHRIAAQGIARTFQNLALFNPLSVRDNVLIGGHGRYHSTMLGDALRLPFARRNDAKLRAEADAILAELDLEAVADRPVAGLPFGTQKRVELARALAARPRLLLLDEPAGGLNHDEVQALGTLIRRLRDTHRLTILLVEHHMGLVMSTADHVVVLDFGRKLAEGPPATIGRNPLVINAYLGQET